MRWKSWGKEDAAQITNCGGYSIHRTAKGWDCWRRLPHLKRIAIAIPQASEAQQVCERDAKQLEEAMI